MTLEAGLLAEDQELAGAMLLVYIAPRKNDLAKQMSFFNVLFFSAVVHLFIVSLFLEECWHLLLQKFSLYKDVLGRMLMTQIFSSVGSEQFLRMDALTPGLTPHLSI